MNHFLLVDKPVSWTSFDVVAVCRKLFREKHVGHNGTLDPFATGLLILGLGSATKELFHLPAEPKTYDGTAVFGAMSSTGDNEGDISFAPNEVLLSDDLNKKMNQEMINKIIQDQFLGDISQVPPIFSAKKIGGVRAYKLARRGKVVDLAPRQVHIFSFHVFDIVPDVIDGHRVWRASFVVEVSSGTYIRSLIQDLGSAIGVSAYTSALRRTRMGDFSLSQAVTVDDLRSCQSPEQFLIEASAVKR